MAVAFNPGSALVRGDLDIFLTNGAGNPADAYSITYALYYVDPTPPETEVLIGSATRTPAHPTVGEYYVNVSIPSDAVPGTYRVRWTFQQFASSPPQQVVQEWAVVAPSTIVAPPTYGGNTAAMIASLRMLLRDQCLGGETEVEVRADGERLVVRLDELYDILSP